MSLKKQKNQRNQFLKYTSLAFQLGLTILVFTYLGVWLDGKYLADTPWFTILCSLLGVVIGLYLALKPLIQDGKEK